MTPTETITHIEVDESFRNKIFVWEGEELLYSINIATHNSRKSKKENVAFIAAAINEKIEREQNKTTQP